MDNVKKRGSLIIVSGFSGSGKGTVLAELFFLGNYKYSVSATTRNPRAGEIEGISYFFLSKEDFANKAANGEMLEYVEYSGNMYGTPKNPVFDMLENGHNVILEIEVFGALKVKKEYPEAVMIFIVPPTFDELKRRLHSRGTETEEAIEKRLEKSRTELKHLACYDYFFINENNMAKKTAYDINTLICTIKNGIQSETAEKAKITREKTENFIKNYFTRIN